MKIKSTITNEGEELEITCENCGLAITKTGEYGMDCENDCSKAKFLASKVKSPMMGFIKSYTQTKI